MNYTDPSGHREIGADENDLLPNQPPPTISEQLAQGYNVYGITFAADEGQEWTNQQMAAVLNGVAAVDRKLRIAGQLSGCEPGYAFRKYYGSYTIYRSARDRKIGGETFSWKNVIEFYSYGLDVNPFHLKFRNNVVHELGHAFNGEISTARSISPYDELGAALSRNGALGGIRNRRSSMAGTPISVWQQSREFTNGELYADYFLNWVYEKFLNNPTGNLTRSWMDQHLTMWLR